jgi:hypothetical protein
MIKYQKQLATPDRGIAALPNSRNLSGTMIKMNTNLRRSVNDAVLEAMKNQLCGGSSMLPQIQETESFYEKYQY